MNQQTPKAILFDLDDTILNYGGNADSVWHEVVHGIAPQVTDMNADTILSAIKEYRDWFWSDPERHRIGRLDLDAASIDIVRNAFKRLGIDSISAADEIALTYRTQRERDLSLFPGAVETLHHFREIDVPLALITNGAKEPQRKKIDDHNLEVFFDCIIIEGEFGNGKPHHSVYLHAMEQLDTTPDETWMVGDNFEWEVVAPKKLGLFSVWVDYAERGIPHDAEVHPDRVVRYISELRS